MDDHGKQARSEPTLTGGPPAGHDSPAEAGETVPDAYAYELSYADMLAVPEDGPQ